MSTLQPGRNGTTRAAAGAGASGNAMVVALLVLMLFTAAGVTFVAVTKSEKQIAGNQMAGTQAMYSAEAGISEALRRMNSGDPANYIGPAAPTPAWGRYLVVKAGNSALDPEGPLQAQDGWDNNHNSYVDEKGERYPEVLSKQPVALDAPVYPYVRVEYKMKANQLVRFGDADHNPATPHVENPTIGAPVLRLTALGRRGTANKVIEAEAVRFPFVDANSALWAGGALKLNGNAFLVDGRDHEMTSPYDLVAGAPPVPGILTEGGVSDAPLGPGQGDNVLGAGGDSCSVQQSTFTYDFNQILAMAGDMADAKLPAGTTLSSADPPLGTLATPKFTLAQGNLSINGTWTGAGILVVNGNLSMGGGSQFKGLVVVLGDIKYTGAGPADVAHIVGALIYQGTLVDDSSIGGAGRLYYSSAAVNNALTLSRYTLAMWRER